MHFFLQSFVMCFSYAFSQKIKMLHTIIVHSSAFCILQRVVNIVKVFASKSTYTGYAVYCYSYMMLATTKKTKKKRLKVALYVVLNIQIFRPLILTMSTVFALQALRACYFGLFYECLLFIYYSIE